MSAGRWWVTNAHRENAIKKLKRPLHNQMWTLYTEKAAKLMAVDQKP